MWIGSVSYLPYGGGSGQALEESLNAVSAPTYVCISLRLFSCCFMTDEAVGLSEPPGKLPTLSHIAMGSDRGWAERTNTSVSSINQLESKLGPCLGCMQSA